MTAHGNMMFWQPWWRPQAESVSLQIKLFPCVLNVAGVFTSPDHCPPPRSLGSRWGCSQNLRIFPHGNSLLAELSLMGIVKVSLFFFAFTLHLDLHPHAPSLPGHAAAKGGDPPVAWDPTPAGKKSHCNQHSFWRILHPETWLFHFISETQQVKPGVYVHMLAIVVVSVPGFGLACMFEEKANEVERVNSCWFRQNPDRWIWRASIHH